MEKKTKKKIVIALLLILLVVALFYVYTYYFAASKEKVIYQDSTRRIYLNEKKEYKKGREMWRMVYEDMQTGKRFFVLGNSQKGFSNKKMAEIILNTVDKSQKKSFDQVQRVGVIVNPATTDVHSNLVAKKGFGDFFNTDFLDLNKTLLAA